MQEGRFFIGKREKPRITVNFSMADFLRDIKFEQKGSMDISGIIEAERKTDDGKIYKTLKITKFKSPTKRTL